MFKKLKESREAKQQAATETFDANLTVLTNALDAGATGVLFEFAASLKESRTVDRMNVWRTTDHGRVTVSPEAVTFVGAHKRVEWKFSKMESVTVDGSLTIIVAGRVKNSGFSADKSDAKFFAAAVTAITERVSAS